MAGRGRPLGSINRNKRPLLALLEQQYPGWNPVLQMAEAANNPELTIEQRLAAAKEAARYIVPQLKAVEVSGPGGDALKVSFNLGIERGDQRDPD